MDSHGKFQDAPVSGVDAEGILAIGCLEVGLATPGDVMTILLLALFRPSPDIDSDHSVPVQLLFSFLAILLAFMTVFSKANAY